MSFYKSSKGKSKIDQKAISFVQELFTYKGFGKMVRRIRYETSIPRRGFDIALFDKLVLQDIHPRFPSKAFKRTLYIQNVKGLLALYGLSFDWFEFISDYILFNYIGDVSYNTSQIILLDLGNKNNNLAEHKKMLAGAAELNPVVFMIPPFASQREISDFIAQNSDNIKDIQKCYQTGNRRIGKKKTNNPRIKERNHFIYLNRNLPKLELMRKVNEKFGVILDYTYLNKIIAAEAKKKGVDI